jgi:hypothetical protein
MLKIITQDKHPKHQLPSTSRQRQLRHFRQCRLRRQFRPTCQQLLEDQ